MPGRQSDDVDLDLEDAALMDRGASEQFGGHP
jgi:hypothetical protein